MIVINKHNQNKYPQEECILAGNYVLQLSYFFKRKLQLNSRLDRNSWCVLPYKEDQEGHSSHLIFFDIQRVAREMECSLFR